MSTTSKRTSPGARAPWSGLLDTLLGRMPGRHAGPQPDEPGPDADAARADGSGSGDTGSGAAATGADGTTKDDSTKDESSALRVNAERVSLDAELGLGAVDGAWWPRSDRAADEVPELLEALPDDLGRVLRVALRMDDWSDDQPRVVQVDGHPLHLAWFAGMRRHTAHLTFEGEASAVLLVLPSDTDEAAAREVLDAVGEERSREDLLSRAGVELDQDSAQSAPQNESD